MDPTTVPVTKLLQFQVTKARLAATMPTDVQAHVPGEHTWGKAGQAKVVGIHTTVAGQSSLNAGKLCQMPSQ